MLLWFRGSECRPIPALRLFTGFRRRTDQKSASIRNLKKELTMFFRGYRLLGMVVRNLKKELSMSLRWYRTPRMVVLNLNNSVLEAARAIEHNNIGAVIVQRDS